MITLSKFHLTETHTWIYACRFQYCFSQAMMQIQQLFHCSHLLHKYEWPQTWLIFHFDQHAVYDQNSLHDTGLDLFDGLSWFALPGLPCMVISRVDSWQYCRNLALSSFDSFCCQNPFMVLRPFVGPTWRETADSSAHLTQWNVVVKFGSCGSFLSLQLNKSYRTAPDNQPPYRPSLEKKRASRTTGAYCLVVWDTLLQYDLQSAVPEKLLCSQPLKFLAGTT